MSTQAIMSSTELGTYLGREIAQRGWSQRQAATAWGVPLTTLNGIIKDGTSPRLVTLRKLADGLKVSVVRLLVLGGVVIGTEDSAMPGAYRALTDVDRAFIAGLSSDELRDFIDYARKQKERYQS